MVKQERRAKRFAIVPRRRRMQKGMSTVASRALRAAVGSGSLAALARKLVRLERGMEELEKEMRPSLARVAPDRRESARNLVHYIALRQHDLRDLQSQLSQRGLSSLGRSESCVMGSLLEASARAHESLALAGNPGAETRAASSREGARVLALLGIGEPIPAPAHARRARAPTRRSAHLHHGHSAPGEGSRAAWMVKLLEAGMNVLRIELRPRKRTRVGPDDPRATRRARPDR